MNDAARAINKETGSSEMCRMLQSMSAFEVENSLPESFRDKLAQLEKAERSSR